MLECYTGKHSVYFEGGYSPDFENYYNGVIVTATIDSCGDHFAIRKPATFRSKLPRFIRKMFPQNRIMLKTRKEKFYELHFLDNELSIQIVADMKNPSCMKLTFGKETYEDLNENIPVFLEEIGFKFKIEKDDCCTTLVFGRKGVV